MYVGHYDATLSICFILFSIFPLTFFPDWLVFACRLCMAGYFYNVEWHFVLILFQSYIEANKTNQPKYDLRNHTWDGGIDTFIISQGLVYEYHTREPINEILLVIIVFSGNNVLGSLWFRLILTSRAWLFSTITIISNYENSFFIFPTLQVYVILWHRS